MDIKNNNIQESKKQNKDMRQSGMPSDTVSITANIMAKLKVHITALYPDFKQQQPVYALNWFDTRWLWLYNLYNLLAAGSVLNVNGFPLFKARVQNTLYGEPKARRDVLLIVRYPSIEQFKSMLQSRYFQLVSMIRGAAVKNFTFAFSTRTDASNVQETKQIQRISQSNAYAIHHYQKANSISAESKRGFDTNQIANTAKQSIQQSTKQSTNHIAEQASSIAEHYGVEIGFSSTVSARLYSQQGDGMISAIDTIMDGCLILQAKTHTDIEQLILSADYQTFMTTLSHSYVATLKRIF